MQREYPIKIYTTYKNQIPKMSFVQGDTGNNKIYFEFYDDINVPMTDIKEATATVKRQDSNTYSYGMDYFVIEDNLVTFILPPSTTFISGTCSASISVYDSDMGRLTTQTFDFEVTPELTATSPIDSSNDYPILTKLIADTQAAKDQTESQYAQALALSSQNANLEIVGARKGEVDLPTKVGKIDTQISDITPLKKSVSSNHNGVIAFQFDDGFESNYLNAFPIFKKYGYVGTIHIETAFINGQFNDGRGNCLKIEQIREMIDAGWEFANHPYITDLNATEQTLYDNAVAENTLFTQLLTGEKIKNPDGTVINGTLQYPQYSDYKFTSMAYQGGQRNATTDKVFAVLYDKIRTIKGTIASRGDYLYAINSRTEEPQFYCGTNSDTSADKLTNILSEIKGVAHSKTSLILYSHDVLSGSTPTTWGSTFPKVNQNELEQMLRLCSNLGILVTTARNLYSGNCLTMTLLDDNEFTFYGSGEVNYDTTEKLYGLPRSIKITSNAYQSVNSSMRRLISAPFIVEPFCRYRVKVYYKINTDLVLYGGTANRNHGLNVVLNCNEGNASSDVISESSSNRVLLNNSTDYAPYQATTGYQVYTSTLVALGTVAQLSVGLFNATGTVWIGFIVVEKLNSIIDVPLTGTANFSTTSYRRIYVPLITNYSGIPSHRQLDWQISIIAQQMPVTRTFDYAFEDSASISSPTDGQTCWILGNGLGAFAGQGGKVARWSTANNQWYFDVSITGRAVYTINNFNGNGIRNIVYMSNFTNNAGQQKEYYMLFSLDSKSWAVKDTDTYKIYNEYGNRADTFTWVARLINNAS